jgi:hypothetical protein
MGWQKDFAICFQQPAPAGYQMDDILSIWRNYCPFEYTKHRISNQRQFIINYYTHRAGSVPWGMVDISFESKSG